VKKGATKSFAARVRAHASMLHTPLPEHVERQRVVIDAVNAQIALADAQLSRIAANHPICRLLMTAPGVGPVTLIRFVAALDDVTRFSSAHQLESYLCLTRRAVKLGDRAQDRHHEGGPDGAASRAGASRVDDLADAAERSATTWAMKIAARRGTFIAVVALARNLAGILFAMWRDGAPYRPARTANSTEPTT